MTRALARPTHNIRLDTGDFRTSEQEYDALIRIVETILVQMHGYRANNDRQLAINEKALNLCHAIKVSPPDKVLEERDALFDLLMDFIAHT